MEDATTQELKGSVQLLSAVERRDLHYDAVAGRQILSALLKEMGLRFAEGYLYQVLQGVANEARRRGLLINPNEFDRQTCKQGRGAKLPYLYSTAVGNTARMMPSSVGWEQTKGIFSRHLLNARAYLEGILNSRSRLK